MKPMIEIEGVMKRFGDFAAVDQADDLVETRPARDGRATVNPLVGALENDVDRRVGWKGFDDRARRHQVARRDAVQSQGVLHPAMLLVAHLATFGG